MKGTNYFLTTRPSCFWLFWVSSMLWFTNWSKWVIRSFIWRLLFSKLRSVSRAYINLSESSNWQAFIMLISAYISWYVWTIIGSKSWVCISTISFWLSISWLFYTATSTEFIRSCWSMRLLLCWIILMELILSDSGDTVPTFCDRSITGSRDLLIYLLLNYFYFAYLELCGDGMAVYLSKITFNGNWPSNNRLLFSYFCGAVV